ncbi:hypothetical protein LZ30DRAFT_775910 [Colletotrichum cereale]|nr:hypothetical protein LZ30DRAFT_775910 [Colletotrichum cereale]
MDHDSQGPSNLDPWTETTRKEGLFALVGRPSPFSMVERLVDVENGSTARFGDPLLGWADSIIRTSTTGHLHIQRQKVERIGGPGGAASDKDQEQNLSVNGLAMESRSGERATRAGSAEKSRRGRLDGPMNSRLPPRQRKHGRRNQTRDKRMGFDKRQV